MSETIINNVPEANTVHHMAGEAYVVAEMLDKAGVPRRVICSDEKERDLSLWGRVLMYGRTVCRP
jgi:hypothetical protein